MNIYNCDECGKKHIEYATIKKLTDKTMNPRHFCSKECVVKWLKGANIKSYDLRLAQGKETDIDWILNELNKKENIENKDE